MSKYYEMPYDMSRCKPSTQDCPVKLSCARFTSKWNPSGFQTVSDNSPFLIEVGGCEMFISNNREEEVDKDASVK